MSPQQSKPALCGAGEQAVDALLVRPPFSFTYGGTASDRLLPTLHRVQTTLHRPDNSETTVIWGDPTTGLRVVWSATRYTELPIVSWVVTFENTGTQPTLQLGEVLALDYWADHPSNAAGDWIIRTNSGSTSAASDFAPRDIALPPDTHRIFTTVGGRSTSGEITAADAASKRSTFRSGWPYVNVDQGAAGLIAAVGWPGQWVAEVRRIGDRRLQVRAGMSQLDSIDDIDGIGGAGLADLWLEPGESIRTPLIVVLPWAGGDWIDAQNVWRRWFFRHHMPKVGGSPVTPRSPAQSNDYFVGQFDTAQDQLRWLDAYAVNGATCTGDGVTDHWWIDAGWYELPPGGNDWNHPGTWSPDPIRYPDGLTPITARAHEVGLRGIVWFEPERVRSRTWLYENYPEWLLRSSATDTDNLLFNFGDPQAQEWMTRRISDLLDSEQIDVYREDSNIDPLPFWNFHDRPGRRGITQIRYVLGHLGFWERLRAHRPELVIDDCSSGGLRLDVQSLALAVNLQRSDCVLDPLGNQVHSNGISPWVVFTGAASRIEGGPDDDYHARSAMAPSFHATVNAEDPAAPWSKLKTLGREWRAIADDMFGDYYPLLRFSGEQDAWAAWQFSRPDHGTGYIQAFRRPRSPVTVQRLTLRGIDPHVDYELLDEGLGSRTRVSGQDLQNEGLLVTLTEAPSATTIRFRVAGR